MKFHDDFSSYENDSCCSRISGVSGLDLCLPNCTWLDGYEELLHPIDAGTDMGVRYNVSLAQTNRSVDQNAPARSFQGPKKPENPRKPIAPILSSNVTDNRSPFFGNFPRAKIFDELRTSSLFSGKQPPPFAKLSIRRVMVQGVACPHGRPQHSDHPSIADFGPNFVDLSRTPEEENEKEVSKSNVDLIGETSRFSNEFCAFVSV